MGGTLTNFKTIRSRVDRLTKIEQMEIMNEFELLPKKEVSKLKQERDKLELYLGGIRNMRQFPGCLFVVDIKKEEIAIREAKRLGIPVVGLVDTNCDPDMVDYVIPGNDDAIRAVKLIASVIANAVIEANQGIAYRVPDEELEGDAVESMADILDAVDAAKAAPKAVEEEVTEVATETEEN